MSKAVTNDSECSFFVTSDYLSAKGLANLESYKYSAIDKSPISNYILKHYWNFSLKLFPLWMAPNLITLIGFSFVCLNLLCVLIFIPDFLGPGPSWLYFSFALGLWLYSTFDNVDGKQARRTGTSSPLGELFDHGCDALNCSVGSLVQAASLSSGHSWYAYVTMFIAMFAFFLTTWEEYHTGTLYLGYINGPTEGLIVACIFSVLSGIMGPTIWRETLHFPKGLISFLPLAKKIDRPLIVLDLLVFSLIFLLFTTHLPFCLWNVYYSSKRKYSYSKSLYQMAPTMLFFTANLFWLTSDTSVALSRNMVIFLIANGVVFSRIVTKIILAHVTGMPFPMYSTKMLLPLCLGSLLVNSQLIFGKSIISPTTETLLIKLYFIAAMLNYFHWAVLVINSFCRHLGINCLTIKRTKKTN